MENNKCLTVNTTFLPQHYHRSRCLHLYMKPEAWRYNCINGSFWGPHDHHHWCLPTWPSPLPTSPCFLVLSSPAVAKLLVASSLAVLLSSTTSVGGRRVLIFSLIYFLFYFIFSLCLLLNMTETHVFCF